MTISAEQAVTGILAKLVESGYSELRAPKPAIHAAFAMVRQKLPEYFPEVSFGKYGALMNSDDIDYVWRSHVMNGLISTDNPDLVVHRVSKGILDYYQSSVEPDLSEAERDLTAEASRIFRSSLEEIASKQDVGALLVQRA